MVDRVWRRQANNLWMIDVGLILLCNLFAARIVGIKLLQFIQENGRLPFIHAAIKAAIVIRIALSLPIIGYAAHRKRQSLVVGGDGTCITQRAEVLAGIETVRSGIAEAARVLAAEQ